GVPDIGLLGAREFADAYRDMLAVTDLPALVDADNGYGDHKNVVPFIEGGWGALKGTEFSAWQSVLTLCQRPEIGAWLEEVAGKPPTSPYNDKYNTVITAFSRLRGVDALPVLEAAAVRAGTAGGPFNNLVETIQRAVQPREIGAAVPPEHRARMEETLVRVAKAVPPEQARLVADRLVNAGSDSVAASLLPAIFPDRVQTGGEILWAAAAVEACDGDALVHWVSWTEAPRRWNITDASTKALRATAAKLKCDSGEWPVLAANEPLKDSAAVATWIEQISADWSAKGNKVKSKQEKVAVPQ
ncbi:MAG TPA: hypothetical protein PKA64_20995, partial [Myxococcota bacterium]|nr:hypothetical protein [Myxococcota bacterium]